MYDVEDLYDATSLKSIQFLSMLSLWKRVEKIIKLQPSEIFYEICMVTRYNHIYKQYKW
jgi:hypothetical protein